MARVRLKDPVRHPGSGAITTIAEMAERGEIEFRRCNHFMAPRSRTGTRVA